MGATIEGPNEKATNLGGKKLDIEVVAKLFGAVAINTKVQEGKLPLTQPGT